MDGNKFILDTNIIIAWFKGENSIVEKISISEQIFIPSIVLGELLFGAMHSSQVEHNVAAINRLTFIYPVISIDGMTAREYGLIKSILKKAGRPIPENDVWIAALSKQYDIPLVTRDKHFKEIEGMKIEEW